MSRTMIDLDKDLVARANQALGGKLTMKDVVHESLRRVVAEEAERRFGDLIDQLGDDEHQELLDVRSRAW